MNAPLPNGLLMLALYAIVGYYLDKCLAHLAETQTGTKSHLFNNNTICL